MTTLTLNFDDEVYKKMYEYAAKNKINLIDYAKKILIDEMTDIEDLTTETITVIEDFEAREKKGTLKTLGHEEVKRILGL